MEWGFIWGRVMSPRLCLVYMTHDWVVSQYCGIGALAQTFLGAIEEIRWNGYSVDMYLVGVDVEGTSLGYNDGLRVKNIQKLKTLGGKLYLVDNNSDKKCQYGNKNNWCAASQNWAQFVDALISEQYDTYDLFVVFCVDTPFLHVPLYSNYFEKDPKVVFAVTLHSTADIHKLYDVDVERKLYEMNALWVYIAAWNVVLAETSKFLWQNLVHLYDVSHDTLVPLHSWVLPYSLKYTEISQSDIEAKLLMYGIDTSKPICFSMWRAEVYKWFDILIHACELLMKQDFNICLVLLCSPYTADDAVLSKIKMLLQQSWLTYVLIDHVDFELPKYICQWHNTKIVAQISLKEPFGLIPEDVRCRARNWGPIILASSRDGYLEQITDGYDGFLTIPESSCVAKKMWTILSLAETTLSGIRKNGFIRACVSYDYAKNLKVFLDYCLSRYA